MGAVITILDQKFKFDYRLMESTEASAIKYQI